MTDTLLDIGCGTAAKLLLLAEHVQLAFGLEPNEKMLAAAARQIFQCGRENVTVLQGVCEDLPFRDDAFDVVTCMLAPHTTSEVHRVLKKGGVAILETIGDRDKWEFTSRFGRDEGGPRARFAQIQAGERAEGYRREFAALFSEVSVRNEFWTTYYTIEGLRLICQITPTVRNFDAESDSPILDTVEREMMTEKGIPLRQNRILIVARK